MKSYDVCQCGAPLRLTERPTPAPRGSEVLLKVLAAGVCHSDLHFWDGVYDLGGGRQLKLTDRGMKLPLTMGHGNVGEVVALGPEAEGVKIGDRRLVHPWIGCGDCDVCREDHENLCLEPGFVGVFRPGGYADYLLVPHPRYLLDIGDLPAAAAAPLACAGVTAYGALKKFDGLLARGPLIIFGLGGVGSMALALLETAGGVGAIVCDIDPKKRELALQMGARAAIDNHAPDALQQIAAAAEGPVWAVADFVGAGETVQLGIDCLTKGGKLVVVGLFGGEITLSTPFIPIKAMTIQGSYTGSLGEMAELIALVRRTGMPKIPVRTRPLAEATAVLHDLKAGTILGRVVLTP